MKDKESMLHECLKGDLSLVSVITTCTSWFAIQYIITSRASLHLSSGLCHCVCCNIYMSPKLNDLN